MNKAKGVRNRTVEDCDFGRPRNSGGEEMKRSIAATAAVIILAFTVFPALVTAATVEPIDAQSETGKTYGEWSANWWQYVLSIPAADNPLFDPTGAECTPQDPSSPVFFLVGSFGGPVTRNQCTVPAGKYLFFPLLNNIFARTEAHETEDFMRNQLTGFIKSIRELHASIDGVPVGGLDGPLSPYRTVSPAFYVTLPEGNIFGLDAGTTLFSVADGVFVMIKPLSQGHHTINFGGVAGAFTVDVTYDPLTAQ